ncbi:MAG: hypothetical protein RI932_254 [Pseudomonadota bacterium]|jgi:predicted amidophosphoribosyltransferase
MAVLLRGAVCNNCDAVLGSSFELFCFACLQKYAAPLWSVCCRCCDSACFGTCGQLGWLKSVDSIFPYSGRHRGLLLAAKDLQDSASIGLFNSVYASIAVQRIVSKLTSENFSFVLLARSRIQRLASYQWHPNDFWLGCVRKAQQQIWRNNPYAKPIPVMMHPSIVFRKRAKTSSSVRRENLFLAHQNAEAQLGAEMQSECSMNVLVLDDVLTSGGSLWQEWTELRCTRQADESVSLHALTLFRTPGATNNPEKDVS